MWGRKCPPNLGGGQPVLAALSHQLCPSVHHLSIHSPPHSVSSSRLSVHPTPFLCSPLRHPLPTDPLLSPVVPISSAAVGVSIPTAGAPITMAPGLRHPRRWNSPDRRGWCRRGRALGAATGGTRRQTGNEHRPSPLPAGADGSPRLWGRRGAGEGTEVTGAGAGTGHRPHTQPHTLACGLAAAGERPWRR